MKTLVAFVVCSLGATTTLLALLTPSRAQVITESTIVTTTNDQRHPSDGLCSLREAINNANSASDTTGFDCAAGTSNDTINFSVSGTITLVGGGLPAIQNTLTIDGSGQSVTVNGAGSYGVFLVNAGAFSLT